MAMVALAEPLQLVVSTISHLLRSPLLPLHRLRSQLFSKPTVMLAAHTHPKNLDMVSSQET